MYSSAGATPWRRMGLAGDEDSDPAPTRQGACCRSSGAAAGAAVPSLRSEPWAEGAVVKCATKILDFMTQWEHEPPASQPAASQPPSLYISQSVSFTRSHFPVHVSSVWEGAALRHAAVSGTPPLSSFRRTATTAFPHSNARDIQNTITNILFDLKLKCHSSRKRYPNEEYGATQQRGDAENARNFKKREAAGEMAVRTV